MSLGKVLRFFGLVDTTSEVQLQAISRRREELSGFTDDQLKSGARALRGSPDLIETFALTAVIAERILGLRMFDVQILGALALVRGHIVEMQTGEGKTLAAVPAVVWFASARSRGPCADRQRLSRPPRRVVDGRDL